MKKIVCILVLHCVIMGAAFAQQKAAAPAEASDGKKNAIGFDAFQLFRGIIASGDNGLYNFTDIAFSSAYERLLVPHFSLGGDLDFYYLNFDVDGYDTSGFYFSMAAEGRYYLLENMNGAFFGTTLGFNVLSIDGETSIDKGGFMGLITSLKMGYKVMIKSFYLEPSLAYVYSKSSIINSLLEFFGDDFSIPTPNGWYPGLRLGFAF